MGAGAPPPNEPKHGESGTNSHRTPAHNTRLSTQKTTRCTTLRANDAWKISSKMAGGWRILPNGGPFCFVYRYAASVDSMGLAEKGVLLEVLKPLDLAVFGRFWDFQKCPFFCQSHAIYRRSVPVHEAKRAPIWQNPPATRKSFRASFAPGNSRKGSGAAGCGPSGYADNGSTRGPPPTMPSGTASRETPRGAHVSTASHATLPR